MPPSSPSQSGALDWKSLRRHARAVIAHRCGGVASWLRSFASAHKKIFNMFAAAFLGAPPFLLGQYYQVTDFANEIRKDWAALAALLDQHVVVGIVASGIWILFWASIARFVRSISQDGPNGWENAATILLHTLDNIVGAKEQRFTGFFKQLSKSGKNIPANQASEVFDNITQPELQLKELVQGVYQAFDSLLRLTTQERHNLKVNLALINKGQVVTIKYHYPSNQPVRSSIQALNSPNSTIKHVCKERKPIVVESIALEATRSNPKFAITDPARETEDGSLLCYPVWYEPFNAIVFVISVHSDKAGTFKSRFVKNYSQILKPFELRMKLEYSLLGLKELAR